MIRSEGNHFLVYKKIDGYRKENSDICKLPPDMVYIGRRATKESAEKLLNENNDRS